MMMPYINIHQHTSSYISIHLHTSTYINIHQNDFRAFSQLSKKNTPDTFQNSLSKQFYNKLFQHISNIKITFFLPGGPGGQKGKILDFGAKSSILETFRRSGGTKSTRKHDSLRLRGLQNTVIYTLRRILTSQKRVFVSTKR